MSDLLEALLLHRHRSGDMEHMQAWAEHLRMQSLTRRVAAQWKLELVRALMKH